MNQSIPIHVTSAAGSTQVVAAGRRGLVTGFHAIGDGAAIGWRIRDGGVGGTLLFELVGITAGAVSEPSFPQGLRFNNGLYVEEVGITTHGITVLVSGPTS